MGSIVKRDLLLQVTQMDEWELEGKDQGDNIETRRIISILHALAAW